MKKFLSKKSEDMTVGDSLLYMVLFSTIYASAWAGIALIMSHAEEIKDAYECVKNKIRSKFHRN